MKKWDSATTTRFVREYSKHTCLWDVNHKSYKCRAARENAIRDIARNMNITDLHPIDVKSKIRIIRNTYINELKKMREKKNRSEGKRTDYLCTIPWFETADRFLRKVVRKKKYPTNLISLDEDDKDDGQDRSSSEHKISSVLVQKDWRLRSPPWTTEDDCITISSLISASSPSNNSSSMFTSSLPSSNFGAENPPSHSYPSSMVKTTFIKIESDDLSSDANQSYPIRGYCKDDNITCNRDETSVKRRIGYQQITSSDKVNNNVNQDGSRIPFLQPNDENEFDVFAKNVALQLNELPLENALQVQAIIHQILINERLKVIRQNKQKDLIVEHNNYKVEDDIVDEEFLDSENKN